MSEADSKVKEENLAAWFEQLSRVLDAYAEVKADIEGYTEDNGRTAAQTATPCESAWPEGLDTSLKASVAKLRRELEMLTAIEPNAAFAAWHRTLLQKEAGKIADLLAWLRSTELPTTLNWYARHSLDLVESKFSELSKSRHTKSWRLIELAAALTVFALVAGVGGAMAISFPNATETSNSPATKPEGEQKENGRAIELAWTKVRMAELIAMRDFDVTQAATLAASRTARVSASCEPLEAELLNGVAQKYEEARKSTDKTSSELIERAGKVSSDTAAKQENTKDVDAKWGTYALLSGLACFVGLALLSWLVVHATLISRDHLRSSREAEDRAGYARLALARLALSGTVAANEALDLIALARPTSKDTDDEDA